MNKRVTHGKPLQATSLSEPIGSSNGFADGRSTPAVLSIATGTPSGVVHQDEAGRFVAGLPQMHQHASGLQRLYRNTRIARRRLAFNVLTDDAVELCERTDTLHERMELYMEHAVPMATEVARKALRQVRDVAGEGAAEYREAGMVDLVIYVSSTGIMAPGVDAQLIENLALPRTTARMTVSFMGCAAALNALRMAADHVRAHPDHRVLVVCLELSSVNVAFDEDINDVIIHSLFGDGCAAVVVGTSGRASDRHGPNDAGRLLLHDHLSYLIPDTPDGIVLGVTGSGVTCKLARELPDYIGAGLGRIIDGFLDKNALDRADIDLWAVHPGGTRIIDKARSVLRLTDEQVAASWTVLNDCGNMLSPAVVFVIERMLRDRQAAGVHAGSKPSTGLAFSFAPGLGVEALLFEAR